MPRSRQLNRNQRWRRRNYWRRRSRGTFLTIFCIQEMTMPRICTMMTARIRPMDRAKRERERGSWVWIGSLGAKQFTGCKITLRRMARARSTWSATLIKCTQTVRQLTMSRLRLLWGRPNSRRSRCPTLFSPCPQWWIWAKTCRTLMKMTTISSLRVAGRISFWNKAALVRNSTCKTNTRIERWALLRLGTIYRTLCRSRSSMRLLQTG